VVALAFPLLSCVAFNVPAIAMLIFAIKNQRLGYKSGGCYEKQEEAGCITALVVTKADKQTRNLSSVSSPLDVGSPLQGAFWNGDRNIGTADFVTSTRLHGSALSSK
jgi:hypothetical protein